VVPGGRDDVRVFKVRHTQAEVYALHRKLMKDRGIDRFHVAAYGPDDRGYEEVVVNVKADAKPVADYLAEHVTHGDRTLFRVVVETWLHPVEVSGGG
jgi:Lon protease-like protein